MGSVRAPSPSRGRVAVMTYYVLHVACTRSRSTLQSTSMLCLCIHVVRIMHVEHSIQSHAAYRVLQTTVLCSYDTL